MQRRKTTTTKVGELLIGSDYPIRIQSMATTDTNDTEASVAQAKRIIDAGGELVRFTTQGTREAENMKNISARLKADGYPQPLVADVHFTAHTADVAALYCEKVRINPGNYVDPGRVFKHLEYTDEEYAAELQKIERKFVPFLNICKEHHTAIRIGVNHGSLSDRIMSRYGDTPAGIVESCMEFLRICRRENFNDVVISIKASNTVVMVNTVRLLVETMDKELTFRNNKINQMPTFVGNNPEDMLPQNFKKFHNSIFAEIFYGFQKSVMKCNRCQNENATYSVINFVIFPLEKTYNDLNKQKNLQTNNNFNMNMNNNYANNNYVNNFYQNNYNNNMYGFNNNMHSNYYNNFRMGVNNIRALNPGTAVPVRRSTSLNLNAIEKKKLTLYDCFKINKNIENLIGANQIYCNVCRSRQDAIMFDEIHIAPNVFIIILNRGRGNAFECDLDFPLDLNLNEYISNPSSPKSYELIGVISHLGKSSMEGHFIAYCKHFDDNWYLFNDGIVTQEEINGVYNGTPYILFYKNKDWN